MFVNSFVIKTP